MSLNNQKNKESIGYKFVTKEKLDRHFEITNRKKYGELKYKEGRNSIFVNHGNKVFLLHNNITNIYTSLPFSILIIGYIVFTDLQNNRLSKKCSNYKS